VIATTAFGSAPTSRVNVLIETSLGAGGVPGSLT
jgi:hypothetical protein